MEQKTRQRGRLKRIRIELTKANLFLNITHNIIIKMCSSSIFSVYIYHVYTFIEKNPTIPNVELRIKNGFYLSALISMEESVKSKTFQ